MGMTRSQNMSNKQETSLRILQRNKNIAVIINETDKNVGPACTDKEKAITESKR